MKIGKLGKATTSISTATSDSITVRNLDLVGDLMGQLSFTEYFFLLTTGRKPTADQTFSGRNPPATETAAVARASATSVTTCSALTSTS